MKRPNDDDMLLAAEWLESNEGESDEREPMVRVAEWLRQSVKTHQTESAIKQIAKQSGSSIKQARIALKRTFK